MEIKCLTLSGMRSKWLLYALFYKGLDMAMAFMRLLVGVQPSVDWWENTIKPVVDDIERMRTECGVQPSLGTGSTGQTAPLGNRAVDHSSATAFSERLADGVHNVDGMLVAVVAPIIKKIVMPIDTGEMASMASLAFDVKSLRLFAATLRHNRPANTKDSNSTANGNGAALVEAVWSSGMIPALADLRFANNEKLIQKMALLIKKVCPEKMLPLAQSLDECADNEELELAIEESYKDVERCDGKNKSPRSKPTQSPVDGDKGDDMQLAMALSRSLASDT
jgi:hypothetical protein